MTSATPKQSPHSIEAEQSVLGGLLLNNRAWHDLSDVLQAQDFYAPDHQILYHEIGDMIGRGRPCDFVTLTEALRQKSLLERAGGVAYVGMLAADTPSASNVIAYARIVRDRALLRGLIHVGQDIASLGFTPGDRAPDALLDIAEGRLFGLKSQSSREHSSCLNMATLMERVEARVDALRANPGSLAGTPTGFVELDRLTMGLTEGDLWVIGGRPGCGKTSLALNIAEHVAVVRRQPAAIFTMEMSAEQLALRLVSSVGRIDQQRLRAGTLSDEEWSRFVRASGVLRAAPLHIDETGALSPLELRARARRLVTRHGVCLIVVDYIQLMQMLSKDTRTNDISEISRGLKALAKELRVPVVALSQLSRGLESRENKRPRMADLRESGSIEQDADVVLFVYRDDYHDPNSLEKGVAELIIAKQRNGPTDTVKTAFLGAYTRFENLLPGFDSRPY